MKIGDLVSLKANHWSRSRALRMGARMGDCVGRVIDDVTRLYIGPQLKVEWMVGGHADWWPVDDLEIVDAVTILSTVATSEVRMSRSKAPS